MNREDKSKKLNSTHFIYLTQSFQLPSETQKLIQINTVLENSLEKELMGWSRNSNRKTSLFVFVLTKKEKYPEPTQREYPHHSKEPIDKKTPVHIYKETISLDVTARK